MSEVKQGECSGDWSVYSGEQFIEAGEGIVRRTGIPWYIGVWLQAPRLASDE